MDCKTVPTGLRPVWRGSCCLLRWLEWAFRDNHYNNYRRIPTRQYMCVHPVDHSSFIIIVVVVVVTMVTSPIVASLSLARTCVVVLTAVVHSRQQQQRQPPKRSFPRFRPSCCLVGKARVVHSMDMVRINTTIPNVHVSKMEHFIVLYCH